MKIITPNYDYTGWEISPDCLIRLQELLVDKNPTRLDIVEFGSGRSTEVMSIFVSTNSIPGVLDSFDADQNYAHSLAKIRTIIPYDDRPVCFGNDYSFYDIKEEDLTSSKYDLVILDGHHGHGRSVAWKLLQDRLEIGCLVLIDDFDHYPFIEDFVKTFPNSKLITQHWEQTTRWVIYEII
jgi:hypothetical protein